jgi:DNA-binding response OmpR family regulator
VKSPGRTRGPERVLVVEDDPDTRQFLASAIAEEGYEPIEDFVRAYRKLHRTHEPPIVVVSARHDAAVVAKEIGARAVVAKPVDVSTLMAKLTSAMHDGRRPTASG